MKAGLEQFLELIFPPPLHCPFCGLPGRDFGRPGVCLRCLDQLVRERQPAAACTHCGRLLEATGLCPDCAQSPPPFYAATAVGLYDGILKEVIQRLKFVKERPLAQALGRLMARRIYEDRRFVRAAWVVPVPMHPRKLYERNYNQAELLAQALAEELGLPLLPALERIVDTPSQGTLDLDGRRANLAGAFAAWGVIGREVLLVDDVFTTGTTAAECARTLLADGAVGVGVITAATGRWR